MQKQKRGKKTAVDRRKSKKYTKGKIIALFISAILFSVIAAEIAYVLYKVRYVKVLAAKLEVSGNVAFALGEENLNVINFGAVVPGGRSRRFITAENREKFDMLTHIRVIGGIKEFLFYESNFIIKPNETKQIDFEVYAPLDTVKGRYAGRIFLVFKRA